MVGVISVCRLDVLHGRGLRGLGSCVGSRGRVVGEELQRQRRRPHQILAAAAVDAAAVVVVVFDVHRRLRIATEAVVDIVVFEVVVIVDSRHLLGNALNTLTRVEDVLAGIFLREDKGKE